MTEPRIIDVVSDLLGDTVILRRSHLFAKLPGDPKRVSWHQDASYWPLTPSRVVSAWLAIDDVRTSATPQCRSSPARTTTFPLTFHDSAEEENKALFQTVRDADACGESPVALEMRAGQISLHSELIPRKEDPSPPSGAGHDAHPAPRRP